MVYRGKCFFIAHRTEHRGVAVGGGTNGTVVKSMKILSLEKKTCRLE